MEFASYLPKPNAQFHRLLTTLTDTKLRCKCVNKLAEIVKARLHDTIRRIQPVRTTGKYLYNNRLDQCLHDANWLYNWLYRVHSAWTSVSHIILSIENSLDESTPKATSVVICYLLDAGDHLSLQQVDYLSLKCEMPKTQTCVGSGSDVITVCGRCDVAAAICRLLLVDDVLALLVAVVFHVDVR